MNCPLAIGRVRVSSHVFALAFRDDVYREEVDADLGEMAVCRTTGVNGFFGCLSTGIF